MPPAIPAHLGQAKKRLELSHRSYDYQQALNQKEQVQAKQPYQQELQRAAGQAEKAMGTHIARYGQPERGTAVQRVNTQYGKRQGFEMPKGGNPRAGQVFSTFFKGNREYHKYSNGETVALPPQQQNDLAQLAKAMNQSKRRSNLPMKAKIKL